jgi:hypothetical protein
MTANKDLKKVIRARQEKTRESYTTARLQVLRAREENPDSKSPQKELISGYVLKCNQTSIRLQIPESNENLTLRTNSVDAWYAVPGQCIEAIVMARRCLCKRSGESFMGGCQSSWLGAASFES